MTIYLLNELHLYRHLLFVLKRKYTFKRVMEGQDGLTKANDLIFKEI